MSGWVSRRFWSEAAIGAAGAGFRVLLDGRAVRTPARNELIVPTRALAEAVRAEWAAVADRIDPRQMPHTRSANAAIDKVAPHFDDVAAMIAAYGETDLLCYRAEGPEELRARQAEAWDPLLDWAARELGARLVVTQGIVPVPQPAESLARLGAEVFALSPFQLTALHDLVSLTGSLVLGLAATDRRFATGRLWELSRIDEAWQIAQWGEDAEAAAAAAIKRAEFEHARNFWSLASCGMSESCATPPEAET